MLGKLAILAKSKVAAGVLGLLVVGGSGTALLLAVQTHTGPFATPGTGTSTAATKTPDDHDGKHAHRVRIEGVLKAYDASAKTISVQVEDATTPKTVGVNDQTRVNGSHASTLGDLAKYLDHPVQVQADKQSDGSLVAWKVTVGGEENDEGDKPSDVTT